LWLENDERTDDITAIVVHLCHDDFAHDHAKAKAKWNVAKVKVKQILGANRPFFFFFFSVNHTRPSWPHLFYLHIQVVATRLPLLSSLSIVAIFLHAVL
jgi:hypothetical protein